MGVGRTDYSIRFQITAAGQTAFSFPFSVGDVADIHLFDHNAALPENAPNRAVEIPASRFSVIPNPNGLDNGGSVTLAVPLAVGRILEIRRITPKVQGMSLHNQAVIPPRALERALDKLTRVDQELQGRLDSVTGYADSLKAALDAEAAERKAADTAEASARTAADTALGKRIDTEATTRANADTALGGRIDKEIADRQAAVTGEASARAAADSVLSNTKADAVALANAALESIARDDALLARIIANIAAIAQLDEGKMPAAPNDGRHYIAFGKLWKSLENAVGNAFGIDLNGHAIATVFLAYLPNKVWDILPDRRVLSRASRSGDSDGIFIITEDRRFAVRVGPPFVRTLDGRAVVSKRPAYLPNKIWDIGNNRITRSRASRAGDSDGVFVIDAGGRAVRVR